MSEIVWRKSTKSGGNGQCVEVATLPDRVLVRDSKNPEGGMLAFTPEEWKAFVGGVESGEFNV